MFGLKFVQIYGMLMMPWLSVVTLDLILLNKFLLMCLVVTPPAIG